ncbi:CLUMA_CG016946, isoform A [Clunio marinus]|uniref:CLUMA_CG016946, isoform A n=1 Tax=Clunio marinus TaxID=568069 RepID=A0A1J1IST0_9DIPT|nr:CLUMA_CG016946, isoform A [Clunio marinus]
MFGMKYVAETISFLNNGNVKQTQLPSSLPQPRMNIGKILSTLQLFKCVCMLQTDDDYMDLVLCEGFVKRRCCC